MGVRPWCDLHNEVWTERLLAGRVKELDNLARSSIADRGDDF
jgi:hypothetical protein